MRNQVWSFGQHDDHDEQLPVQVEPGRRQGAQSA